jgi:hypothetical protein
MNNRILIDRSVLKKIIYKNYKNSNLYQKSVFNIKNFVIKNYFYLLFLIFVGVIIFLNYMKKEKYSNKNSLIKNVKKVDYNDLEEESYSVKDNSKLSENDFMFKYGQHLKKVSPIPKYNV